jgi:hypothetical protein
MAAGAGCTREVPPGQARDAVTLEIKDKKVEAEVACDVLSVGLMNRPSLRKTTE